MADRTVTAKLVLDTAGYIPAAEAASKSTTGLAAAQKEAAASMKSATAAQASNTASSIEAAKTTQQLTLAKRAAISAAKDAAVAESQATATLVAAQKESEAAAKDATELGAARRAAAAEAVDSAKQEAAAAIEAKAAADAQSRSASSALTAHRDAMTAANLDAAAAAAASKTTEDSAKKQSQAYTSTGKVMMTVGAGLVGAFALAEKATSDFNKSLSGVQAVSNASATDMGLLRNAALDAGKATAFTATEAADAEGELVKAGVSVKDVLGGALSGALSLAAAGQLSLADAATISANAMNTFALKGSDVPHIADVLAAAANKSAADVSQLAYALQQGGLVAAQTGLSFEDTAAVLAAFADRGLEGADAGTSLKTMLEKLNAPTTQAKGLMQQLGIVTYDAQGKFVGITQFAGELHDKLGSLTDAQRNQALATIFGSDAIRAASVLYSLGADGVKGYTQAVNDQGAAGRMAAEQMNNFSGDLKQLKGSIDVALIQGGSGANVVLRDMAQTATKVVNAFANLPKPLQEAAVGFSGGAGTALLLVGGLTSLAGKAASTKKTLSEVAEASSGMKGALASAGSFMAGPWGIAIAGAATVIGIFASNHGKAKIAVDDFTSSIQQDGDVIGKTTTQTVADDLAKKGLIARYQELGISGHTLTDAVLGNKDALAAVTAATNDAVAASHPQIVAAGRTASSINTRADALKNDLATVLAYKDGVAGQIRTDQLATAATQGSTAATGESAAATAKAAKAAKDAAATAMEQAAGQRAVFDANIADADAATVSTDATKAHTSAKVKNASASGASSSATKADTAASKADTTAKNDATKATDAQSKASADAAKASAAAANAAAVNGNQNASAANKTKANAAAARDAAAASKADATAKNDAAKAAAAAAAAADKHTAANDKGAKAADAAAKAATAQSNANAADAKAQAAAAEAAREATLTHQLGVKWLLAVADAEAEATGSARDLDSSVTDEVDTMKDAKTVASSLKDALDALNGVHIAASKAAVDEQQKVADLTKAFYDNGKSLDITTEAGRKNVTAIDDMASAANAHAQAVTEESGSIDAGNKALDASRGELDAVLKQAGLTTDQIDEFNKSLLNTPKLAPVTIQVQADTSAANAALQALENKYAGTGLSFGGGPGGKHIIPGMATGGLVTGAGGPTSDSVPIAASAGEYIVKASAVQQPGVLAALNSLNFGNGSTSVVKPSIPLHPLPAQATSSSGSRGAALHVENYFENGAPPQQVAAELGWLAKSRGGSW